MNAPFFSVNEVLSNFAFVADREIVVFSFLAFHAPALNVRIASPESLIDGVVAEPELELELNLTHLLAVYA